MSKYEIINSLFTNNRYNWCHHMAI